MSEQSPCSDGGPCENTDRHLWPQTTPHDAPVESLFVTKEGAIGINIAGSVIVMPLRKWHALYAAVEIRDQEMDEMIAKLEASEKKLSAALQTVDEQDRFIAEHLTTRSDDKRDLASVIAHLRFGDSDGQDHDDAADEIERLSS